MDLATFERQALRLPGDISVFIRGAHGIGKTEVVHEIAKKLKLPVMQRRLSQLTEGDLIGIPNKVDKKYGVGDVKITKKYSEFLPMEWFVRCMDEPHLIFLDEIDRALPEVIQAAFELCYDRCIQGKKIHDGCRIYAAGNSGTRSSAYQVNMLDPAFLSRFWVADATPTVDEWLEWARKAGVHKYITSFIEDEEEHLELSPDEKLKPEYIYPSRRSWYRLHRALALTDLLEDPIDGDDLLSMCSGFIGGHASAAFVKHVRTAGSRISADDILNRFGLIYYQIKTSKIEDKSTLIKKLYKHSKENLWSDKQIKNVIDFLEALPDELKMILNEYMTRLDVRQENARNYTRASREIMREVARKR